MPRFFFGACANALAATFLTFVLELLLLSSLLAAFAGFFPVAILYPQSVYLTKLWHEKAKYAMSSFQLAGAREKVSIIQLEQELIPIAQSHPCGSSHRNWRDKTRHPPSKSWFSTILISIMEPEFAIRDAVIEDAPSIAWVNYLTWMHAYRGLIPDSELDSLNLESLTDRWKQDLSLVHPRSSTSVVVNSDSLIAYSRFYPSVDPDDDPDRVATIGSLYVSPEFQGKGIGRKLIGAVLEAVKRHDFTESTLHVLAANRRAREFYENLGWERDLDMDIGGSDEKTNPKVRYRKSPL